MSERRPHLWCLFDRRTSRVIEGLLFDEARAFVSNLEATELEHFYAWKEEWPDWRPVNEVEGITEMIFRSMHVSPPPPPKGTEELPKVAAVKNESRRGDTEVSSIVSDKFPQQDAGSISLISGDDFVVRSQKRFRKRMQITIVGKEKNQVFKSFTRDIGVGGMYLTESAPTWVNGYFKVRIGKTNSKQIIELNCGLIDDQPEGERFRIAILPLQSLEDEKNLEVWLAA